MTLVCDCFCIFCYLFGIYWLERDHAIFIVSHLLQRVQLMFSLSWSQFYLTFLVNCFFRAYPCCRGTKSTDSYIFHNAMDVSLVWVMESSWLSFADYLKVFSFATCVFLSRLVVLMHGLMGNLKLLCTIYYLFTQADQWVSTSFVTCQAISWISSEFI